MQSNQSLRPPRPCPHTHPDRRRRTGRPGPHAHPHTPPARCDPHPPASPAECRRPRCRPSVGSAIYPCYSHEYKALLIVVIIGATSLTRTKSMPDDQCDEADGSDAHPNNPSCPKVVRGSVQPIEGLLGRIHLRARCNRATLERISGVARHRTRCKPTRRDTIGQRRCSNLAALAGGLGARAITDFATFCPRSFQSGDVHRSR